MQDGGSHMHMCYAVDRFAYIKKYHLMMQFQTLRNVLFEYIVNKYMENGITYTF